MTVYTALIGTQMTINKRQYTVTAIETLWDDGDIARVLLTSASGQNKRAMFFKGEFDVWDTPPKSKSKFSRVNMRG